MVWWIMWTMSTARLTTLFTLASSLLFLQKAGQCAEAAAAATAFITQQHSSIRQHHHAQRRSTTGAPTAAHSCNGQSPPPPQRHQATMGILRPGVGASLSRKARGLLWCRTVRQQQPPALDAVASRVGGRRWRNDKSEGPGAGDVGDGGVDTTAPAEIQRAASMRDQIWAMLRPDMPRVSF